jgi:hypothetical protein
MPAANLAFDTILSTTMNKYRGRLEDNIFRANPLMYWLQETNRVDKQDGGASLVVPIIAVNPAVSLSYTDYDAFTTQITGAQAAQLDAANYAWRQFAGVVAISGIEEAKNNGVSQVVKLLDAKVQLTELSMAEALDSMFFLNGTGNSGKDWFGLAAICSDVNAGAAAGGNTSGFIGGIDRTAAPGTTMWKSYVEPTAEVLTLARMTTAYNSVSKGNDHPDLGLTTQTLFEKYEGLLQPQARYTDMKTADGGFQNLLFKGMVLMFDLYCQAATMYFLNSKYLKLLGHTQTWFRNTPWIKRHDMDARFMQVLSYGNMTASNVSRQGKLTGKTP